jgi:hypothetical protein
VRAPPTVLPSDGAQRFRCSTEQGKSARPRVVQREDMTRDDSSLCCCDQNAQTETMRDLAPRADCSCRMPPLVSPDLWSIRLQGCAMLLQTHSALPTLLCSYCAPYISNALQALREALCLLQGGEQASVLQIGPLRISWRCVMSKHNRR